MPCCADRPASLGDDRPRPGAERAVEDGPCDFSATLHNGGKLPKSGARPRCSCPASQHRRGPLRRPGPDKGAWDEPHPRPKSCLPVPRHPSGRGRRPASDSRRGPDRGYSGGRPPSPESKREPHRQHSSHCRRQARRRRRLPDHLLAAGNGVMHDMSSGIEPENHVAREGGRGNARDHRAIDRTGVCRRQAILEQRLPDDRANSVSTDYRLRTHAGAIGQSEDRRLIIEAQFLHKATSEKLDSGSGQSGITQSLDEIATMNEAVRCTETCLELRAEKYCRIGSPATARPGRSAP